MVSADRHELGRIQKDRCRKDQLESTGERSMQFDFKIKYDAEESWQFRGVDAYWGTKSLVGLSQILLITVHASLHEEVLVQAPAAKGFRVVLGTSRQGSWEQILSLVPTDPATVALLKDLGKDALYDVLKWALLSGVGIPYVLTNRKAKKRIAQLEREVDDLQERLEASMSDVHLPVKNQKLTIKVMGGRTVLAQFDQNTLEYLEQEIVSNETSLVYLGVSRFNARTGWGRVIDAIDSPSIPISPSGTLSSKQKERMASSLREIAQGRFQALPMIISEVTAPNGALKRYKLHDLPEAD